MGSLPLTQIYASDQFLMRGKKNHPDHANLSCPDPRLLLLCKRKPPSAKVGVGWWWWWRWVGLRVEEARWRRQTQGDKHNVWAKTCLLNTSSLFVVRSQPEWEEKWSGGGGGSRWRWGRVGRGGNAPRRLLEAANDEACEPQLSSLLCFFWSVHTLCRFAAASREAPLVPAVSAWSACRKKKKKRKAEGKSSRLLRESGHLISGLARGRG